MKNKCIATLLLVGLTRATMGASGPTATFRLLFDPGHLGYTQPGAITQITPETFLINVDSAAILAVTKAGRGTALVRDPAQGGLYPPAAASNGRAYTSFAGANSNTAKYVMSFSPESGSTVSYAQQPAVPIFSAALPGGTLLGAGGDIEGYEHLLVSSLAGSVTSIYTFSANVIAQTPPFVGSDGNYYGVGYYRYSPGSAYVYQVTPSGAFTQIANLPDASFSYNNVGSALFQAADGNLYGTTLTGGNGYGTFYRVTLSGQYTLLYTFPKKTHNSFPGNMFQGSDGNFYGVANGCCSGGPADVGTVFQLTPSMQYTALVTMNGDKGQCPCGLIQGSDGKFYGTTGNSGPSGAGTVFEIDLGLPTPAPRARSFQPSSGRQGRDVMIWGNNLLAAKVSFNGVASKDVHSSGPNYVWARVPEGATSGPITITTAGGTSTTVATFTVTSAAEAARKEMRK